MRNMLPGSGLALVCLLAVGSAQAQQLSPAMPLDVANMPQPSNIDWNVLAWQSFVASNWPVAPGARGLPDPAQKIGAVDGAGVSVPVVWMTSKGIKDVFLPQGAAPAADWQSQVPVPACQSRPGYDPATSYVLGIVSKATEKAFTEINQAPFPGSQQLIGPLVDQARNYVRYDIRMSQSEFAYFLFTKYYNAATQKAAVQNPATFVFPPRSGQENYLSALPASAKYGTVEYKAAWRVLDPAVDIISRYFTATAFIVDPDGTTCIGPQLVGLTGLHVLRLTSSTPATWFWASFEQVDNLTVPSPAPKRPNGQPLTPTFSDGKTIYPSGYNYMPPVVKAGQPLPPQPAPVLVSRLTPIQSTSAQISGTYQQLLAGTVWQNYQLVGVQNPVNPMQNGQPQGSGQGSGQCYAAGNNRESMPAFQINDCYLANVAMETFVQSTSCVTCHSYAAPIGVQRTSRGRPTFDALDQFQIFTFMLLEAKAPSP